jgi:nicotinamidase-related amidase
VLRKYASSAFEDTELDARLKVLEADTLVVCGLQSEFCVTNTARSALGLGYQVLLAEDAHNTWPSQEEGRSAAEIRAEVNAQLAEAGAALATTERLVAQLAAR